MVEILRRVERDAVEHLARRIVDHFELDMFAEFAYEFARAEVGDAARAEYRFCVARSERIELA